MYRIIVILIVSNIALALYTSFPCIQKNVKFGIVCVCNDTYCDTLDIPESNGDGHFTLITSSESGDRFSSTNGFFQRERIPNFKPASFLYIDTRIVYQKIHGFGTSFTGVVSYILNKMSRNLRECIYKSYFSNDMGMRYTLMRVPIGGTDFDFGPWAYGEGDEGDITLNRFKQLDPRDIERNVHIREMVSSSRNSLNILAASWGPPRWLKMKNQWNSTLDNHLRPEYYQTWANYHLTWVHLMHKDGVPICVISTGNEPATAYKIPFQILGWQASNQAKWIAENLGPTFEKSNYSHIQIHGYDDNRDKALSWIDEMNKTYPKSMSYIRAFDIHGYLDRMTSPNILDKIHSRYIDKPIWYTEMSFGGMNMLGENGPKLGSWERAEQFLFILMSALNHSVVSYIDWNLILDHHGGPNYIKNYLDAMIMSNENFTEIYKQPLFYAMAHFSRFIPPGSIRIYTKFVSIPVERVHTLAFLLPDKKNVSLIIHNNETHSVHIKIMDRFRGQAFVELKPKSINTLVFSAQ